MTLLKWKFEIENDSLKVNLMGVQYLVVQHN
jgi:hypothetical protein